MMERFDIIKNYMQERTEEIATVLSAIAALPSVKSESNDKNEPFGHDCAVCLAECAELFEREGFETKLYPESGYALVRYGSGKTGKSIGLFAHTDVVPVNEDEWVYTKPFEPKRIGDLLIGRGVSDNKSGVVASLYILKALRDLDIKLENDVVVFLGSCEETGMDDIKNFVREQSMPTLSLVPDSGFPLCYGQKGMLRFDVRARKPFKDIALISGGNAYNVVCDRVKAKIKTSDLLIRELAVKPEYINVELGETFITVEAVGKSAHASRADAGVNALKLMADYLLTLSAVCDEDKAVLGKVSESLSSCFGENFGVAMNAEPFGALTAANGIVRTIDGHIDYSFDVRFGDAIPEDVMVSRIRDYFEAKELDYTEYSLSHCMTADKESRYVYTFMDAYRELTGDTESSPYVMGGGTYAYYLKNAYATAAATWKKPELDFPAGHGGAHQADEFISVSGLPEGMSMLCEIIAREDAIL